MDDEAFVVVIEEARTGNNKNWMDILRLALRVAPKETKALLRKIVLHDRVIANLLEELGNEHAGD